MLYGGCSGEKDPETGHANDGREGLFAINAFALTATLDNEPCLESADVVNLIGFNLVNPHVVCSPSGMGKGKQGTTCRSTEESRIYVA
jgi:hypothetical protein